MALSIPPQGNRKVLFILLIGLGVLLLIGGLWYHSDSHNFSTLLRSRGGTGRASKLLTPPPLWYNVISTRTDNYELVNALTGFKVVLERFREYTGDVSLKPRPGQAVKTGLVTDKCDGLTKWAVITTVAPQTTSTITVLLDSSPDFCLVVVGDRKSPASYELKAHTERFVYLTIEDQAALPLELVALTPENTFARKNIGFLYAIANGAKIILDMDDDNVPIKLNDKFFPMEEKAGVYTAPKVDVEKEGHVWNPYPYYGLPESWPRGYPLDRVIPLDRPLKTEQLRCLPIIQQYMANRDPDVDAIYRLTHPLPVDYNADRQRMVLPHGVYCPYNAQATIHLDRAFWSMLLPKTVCGRVTDIWRAYISQYVMSYVPDMCLMFAPPAVRHERNSHNYMFDFSSELPLYLLAPGLVELFANTPPESAPFEEVLRNTYVMLFEYGVLEEEDVQYVIAWINDLNKLGYEFPKLK